MKTYFRRWRSPVGELLLVSNGNALTRLHLKNAAHYPEVDESWLEDESLEIFDRTITQLDEYFRGERKSFDLKIEMTGTDFQKKVWNQLRQIPFGETVSYKQLAERIGKPRAIRAVGQANGRNPISILVPCHRVLGANGTLTGYAGGLHSKNYLIALEKGPDRTHVVRQ